MHRSFTKPFTVALAISVISFMPISQTHAADLELSLIIKNNKFEPSELKVPANQRVKLNIQNLDKTAEEFESHSMKKEKVIPAGGKAVIYLGPLKPGSYEFIGEFNPKTAKGLVIAE
jgi:Cupredoxin-like domain